MRSRRAFLKRSLHALPLISLAPSVPRFLARTAHAATPARDARVLVVIQLDGGNDGINTVVPYKDDGYAKNREALRLNQRDLIKVSDGLGLNPAMASAGKLLEDGRLAIVQGVSYPNPSRSHFASMATWHTARLDPEDHAGPGWLGRALDGQANRAGSSMFVGLGATPRALQGRLCSTSAVETLDDFKLDPEAPASAPPVGDAKDELAAFARRTAIDAYATADRIAALGRQADATDRYPATALGEKLALVARILKAGLGARVIYTTQPGYDTHFNQLTVHPQLLSELSRALAAFLDDLSAAKLDDRVTVLCFSEFGRRVAENGSGTDHGTAGPVFVAGSQVAPGVVGATPSLMDLDAEGDLKGSIDFRRVYATLLDQWLGLPTAEALGGSFDPIRIIRG